MKTKKKTKNNEGMPTTEQALREQLRQGTGGMLRWRTVPLTALWQMVAAGNALVKRAPEAATELETEARTGVAQSCQLGEAVLAHNANIETPTVKAQKDAVAARAGAIKTAVKLWATSGTEEVAAAAREVLRGLFPAAEQLALLTTHGLWQAVAMKKVLLEEQPALAEALAVLLPDSQADDLFAANDALAAAMGHLGEQGGARLDEKAAARHLHQRMTRYQAALMAGVDPADAEAVRRVDQALQPIDELRGQLARSRERTVRAKRAAKAVPTPPVPPPAQEPVPVKPPLPEGATD